MHRAANRLCRTATSAITRLVENDRIARLTEQQRVCLRMVYSHLTSKEIAPRLGIEPNSVDQHIKAAMRTLGVSDRRTAALILAEHENRLATVELRETQAPFAAFPPPATADFLSSPPKTSWIRNIMMAVIALFMAALAIGIVLAAIEVWLRIFRI